MTPASDNIDNRDAAAAPTAVQVLLEFGVAMLRAGNTASRTRECMDILADKMGFAVSAMLSLDNVSVSLRGSGTSTMAMRECGAPAVDLSRLASLEQLAENASHGVSPHEIAAGLVKIENAKPCYPRLLVATAVAVASAAFAFLNGAAMPEMLAAAIGSASGQALRPALARRSYNQYAVAALAALMASGIYVLTAMLAARAGLQLPHYSAGFIASVLFLVPGIPLIGGLFDLLHYQFLAAASRIAYGAMILLAVAFGLSIVIEAGAIDISRSPPPELAYPIALLLRAIASFFAAAALAMLFNAALPAALVAGVVGLVANTLRLALIDFGMALAPAAFMAALVIGLLALFMQRRFEVPLMATTVAPTVIMVPGLYAFESIVRFNHNEMLEALQAFSVCGFVVGALAMGLATARLFGGGRKH